MIVRVDALGLLLEARRALVAEVLGGFFGQAALGRWWLPCTVLADGEAPGDAAVRAVKEQVGLDLTDAVVVGARPQQIGPDWHLGLVVAGALGGEPDPRPPVSGYSLRTLAELPDQVGPWHRDDLGLLAARYELLRG
jgi:ADP-ribose pyrophosphatase YjhB (NUDIX family)